MNGSSYFNGSNYIVQGLGMWSGKMRRLLSPVLFDDEENDFPQKDRADVVGPAHRSEKAKQKFKSTKSRLGLIPPLNPKIMI